MSKMVVSRPDGSKKFPFTSFKQVQKAIRVNAGSKITVILRGGVYELSETLIFTDEDTSLPSTEVEITSYPGEKVTISGGRKIKEQWIKQRSNIWKLKLKGYNPGKDYFRTLYVDNQPLTRASSDTLFSTGPLPQYAKSFKKYDFKAIEKLRKDSLDAFCGFKYVSKALNSLYDISSAEVIVYNSWEASWHTIRDIDKKNSIITFNNPATYPVGFFAPRLRFRVENSLDFLKHAGEWVLASASGEIYYHAYPGQNPNDYEFTIPNLDTLILLKGNEQKKRHVQNISFSNLNFSYTSAAWGKSNLKEDVKAFNSIKFPYLDFSQGFSSAQAALDCGEAILFEWAKNCTFTNCNFSNLGNYAIRIGKYSNDNIISDSQISNIGGGGIIIGFNVSGGKRKSIPDKMSPSGNKILRCQISKCGQIFPASVGIGIMQANNSLIKHNTVFDLPYTGISVGWSYSFADTYTINNLIEYNTIYSVMKILADGGGIYTLGKQTGSVFRGNHIRDIFRSPNAVGSTNNGFFFDEGSSDFRVDSNIVLNIQNKDIRFNKTDTTRIKFGPNHFEKSSFNDTLLKLKLGSPIR
ncbi:right-handed parallel beta-helix repeat-containing protein [Dyadobacter sp. CY312]|uniref:right-handed parallel beta-helix repeat-containing protein n=1 Tax=Dyadobacter sp. CY312 TaxID=2907303 RepID=UPI001F3EF0A6|nr:right-handed parallel beta-helix repeat-containing protein [Dyadobacter sp. CY312]MCE7040497.1 right-handed parallel beta-helix repeat-containing protein [Dyadobacter sp. CY312]